MKQYLYFKECLSRDNPMIIFKTKGQWQPFGNKEVYLVTLILHSISGEAKSGVSLSLSVCFGHIFSRRAHL